MMPRDAQNSTQSPISNNATKGVNLSSKYKAEKHIDNNTEAKPEWTNDSNTRQKLLQERKRKLVLDARQ